MTAHNSSTLQAFRTALEAEGDETELAHHATKLVGDLKAVSLTSKTTATQLETAKQQVSSSKQEIEALNKWKTSTVSSVKTIAELDSSVGEDTLIDTLKAKLTEEKAKASDRLAQEKTQLA